MTRWWTTPVETRWKLLNVPGWSRFAVVAWYFAAVNWLIFAPAGALPDVQGFFAHQDKVAHGAMFFVLALLARWSSPAGLDRRLRYGVPAALLSYACAAEVLQPLIAGRGRQFEWLDMASNVVGLCSGWLLFGGAIARARGCPSLPVHTPGTPVWRGDRP